LSIPTLAAGDQWLADLLVQGEQYRGNQSKLEQSTIDTWKDGGEIVREKRPVPCMVSSSLLSPCNS